LFKIRAISEMIEISPLKVAPGPRELDFGLRGWHRKARESAALSRQCMAGGNNPVPEGYKVGREHKSRQLSRCMIS
jgi:hypothetical protein